MNTFIRLSDSLEMTEQDIDPLCVIPNINFNPDATQYIKVRQWAKPSFDAVRQEVVKAPAALVDSVWTQQWQVAFKYNDYTDSEGVLHTRAEQEEAATEAARVASVPKSVTRRQAKQALLLAGLLGNVQPALDAIPDATQRGLMQLEWDESLEFERSRPSLIAIGGALGLDGAALDQLFITAAAL
jgi:hypothetical protein